jgi:hypothetical protein
MGAQEGGLGAALGLKYTWSDNQNAPENPQVERSMVETMTYPSTPVVHGKGLGYMPDLVAMLGRPDGANQAQLLSSPLFGAQQQMGGPKLG